MSHNYIKAESDTTKGRYVVLATQEENNEFAVVGSAHPLVIEELASLRLEEGRAYALGAVYPYSAPLAAGASINIAIAFPSGVTPNIAINGLCAGDAMGFLFENAVVTGGTSIVPINKNRNSTTASSGVALLNPTVSSTGTTLLSQILIGGSGKKASGGQMGSTDIILKPLTTYLFRLTNANGTAHAAEIVLEWYE